jgi:hypothetical protein
MSDYTVGYGKPPVNTRWQKGQCGNPMKKRPRKIPNAADMIDAKLAKKVSLKEKGVKLRLTGFEVILLQLNQHIAQGSKRALRIWKKYQAYAQAHPTIVNVVEVDYGTPEEVAAAFHAMLEPKEPLTKEEIEYDEAFSQLTAIEASEAYHEIVNSLEVED